MTPTDPTDARLALLAHGYAPIPCTGKAPAINGWQNWQTNPNEIKLWLKLYPTAINTGALTKFTPAIDVDITFLPAAEAIEELAREEFEERGYVLTRIGLPPKRAVLLRTDEPFAKETRAFTAPDGSKHKIEVLGDGQQVVVDGIHPDTGKPYTWHGGSPLTIAWGDLPYVRRDDIITFLDKAVTALESFGFQLAGDAGGGNRAANGHDDGTRADWVILAGNIVSGTDLHDSIARLAASYISAGISDAAAIRLLEQLMLLSGAPHDERWRSRFNDIPRAVGTARQRFGIDAEEAPAEQPQPKWPTLDTAAMYGLAGDVVRTIEPHSEADPVAILIQFLTAFGSAAGNGPFFEVEADHHRGNLFVVLCGESAKARKGTSWGRVRQIMAHVDRTWADTRALGGLSTGEGLIHEVRDERREWDKKNKCEEIVDAGVTDKRLLVTEPEFARTITTASRAGNILSAVLRQAWDTGRLATLTKNSPLRATGAHISVIGHITIAELRSVLTSTDVMNGYANRFMFFLVRRSKLLPFGGDLDDDAIAALGARVRRALERARGHSVVAGVVQPTRWAGRRGFHRRPDRPAPRRRHIRPTPPRIATWRRRPAGARHRSGSHRRVARIGAPCGRTALPLAPLRRQPCR